jgi:hypothetical protein
MHRLACLRDDVIFLIFCYQRWKYRTDYSRVNEYGQLCEDPNATAEKDSTEDEKLTIQQQQQQQESSDMNVLMLDDAGKGSQGTRDLRRRRGAREKQLSSR